MVNECCRMVILSSRAKRLANVDLAEFISRGSVEIGGENSIKMRKGQRIVIGKQ